MSNHTFGWWGSPASDNFDQWEQSLLDSHNAYEREAERIRKGQSIADFNAERERELNMDKQPAQKTGRPPIGERAMTGAERLRKHRAKKAETMPLTNAEKQKRWRDKRNALAKQAEILLAPQPQIFSPKSWEDPYRIAQCRIASLEAQVKSLSIRLNEDGALRARVERLKDLLHEAISEIPVIDRNGDFRERGQDLIKRIQGEIYK